MTASTATQAQAEYVTYEEAAAILGMTLGSTRGLVVRRHLHPIPDPADGRRRLLLRSEVEARARLRQQHPYGLQPYSRLRDAQAPRAEGAQLTSDERRLLVGVAAGTLALAAIVALARSSDPVIRGMAVGVLVALATLCIAEWYRAGTIDAVERRQLERLLKEDAAPDEQIEHIVAALDVYGVPAAAVGLAS